MLPTGGSTEVSASVFEEAGTPVQNGTTVRFSTNLGRVEPAEAQTATASPPRRSSPATSPAWPMVKAVSGGTDVAGNTTPRTP